MRIRLNDGSHRASELPKIFLVIATAAAVFPNRVFGQTASTGALAGTVTDPSGAVIPGVAVRLVSQTTGKSGN